MASDLVECLRAMADRTTRHSYQIGAYWNAVDEAADEIERLRAALTTARREERERVKERAAVIADSWTRNIGNEGKVPVEAIYSAARNIAAAIRVLGDE